MRRSLGEMVASSPPGDSGIVTAAAVLTQTPVPSSVPLTRRPIHEPPLITSHSSPRQNSQKDVDEELIERGRVYVGEMIGEVSRLDSGSGHRCKDWAESLTADDLREYGRSPRDSRGTIAFMHFAQWTADSEPMRALESASNVGTSWKRSHVTMRSRRRTSRMRMPHGLGSVSEDGLMHERSYQARFGSGQSTSSESRSRNSSSRIDKRERERRRGAGVV